MSLPGSRQERPKMTNQMRVKAFTIARSLGAYRTTRAIANRKACYKEIIKAARIELSQEQIVKIIKEHNCVEWAYQLLINDMHLFTKTMRELHAFIAAKADEHWACAALTRLNGFTDHERLLLINRAAKTHAGYLIKNCKSLRWMEERYLRCFT